MRRLRIAMTGVRGVLGGLLAERLDADVSCCRIVLLDLVPPKRPLQKAVFYRTDLTDPFSARQISDALERERPDVLVHAAFLQSPIRNTHYAWDLESAGTKHLLQGLADGGADALLVLTGSTLSYGANPENSGLLGEEMPLRGRRDYPFVAGKIDAEEQVRGFASQSGRAVSVLRVAPLLAPGISTLTSRYLSLRRVPTVLGFNPLLQLLHPEDAVEATMLVIRRTFLEPSGGTWNVVGTGALPLLSMIRLARRRSLPLPGFVGAAVLDTLFHAGAALVPAAHLDYMSHPWVADGRRAREELGFSPRFSTRECVLAFASGVDPVAA